MFSILYWEIKYLKISKLGPYNISTSLLNDDNFLLISIKELYINPKCLSLVSG